MKEWTMLVEWNIGDDSDPEAVSGSSTKNVLRIAQYETKSRNVNCVPQILTK